MQDGFRRSRRRAGKGGIHIQRYLLVYVQEYLAGVLHSPLHVGNREVRGQLCDRSAGGQMDGQPERMVLAMQMKSAVELHVAAAGEIDGARNVRRAIDNLGKRSTLENVTLHTPVSRGVTALAAAGIDNDTPGNIARRWIDPEAALFQRECAMNGM